LITVGTLNQLYKAPDVLIRAVAECVRNGSDIELVLVGDGKHRAELEGLAVSEGIGARVHFKGQLSSGEAVRRELDQSDLFVLPSLTEGLPRAMIEAMARALPCIGSTVGGIPELLEPGHTVPPGDVKALANKIKQVTSNPSQIAAMSRRNLEKSMEYQEDNLRERRVAFYRYIRDTTQEWLQQRSN
jgi:glycosyltransferase involved in cell wall biosynthesis